MFARRSLALLLALAAALLAAAPALAGGKPGAGPGPPGPPTDQLVIRLAPGKSLDTTALAATAGIDLKQLRKLADGSYVLKLGEAPRR